MSIGQSIPDDEAGPSANPARREFLSRTSAVAAAAAGSTLWGCSGGSPTDSGELTQLSASDAIAAMARGDVRAEDYALALLNRSTQLEALNAFRTLVPDDVLEAARAADVRRASGATLGALHGLPIPVKDSVNTARYATSNGTAILRNFRPASDAGVLRPLLDAGGYIMGKTNLHEISLGWTSASAFGDVHNPYDVGRVPGGSSGGSAVAVAARMAPLAIAEDTLGSIRIPSTMCGICGLRPTYGRYPDDGIMPITTSGFDQVGPLARTVEDLALFDAVVSGDSSPLPAVDLNGVRIGVAEFFFEGLDSEVERVVETALDRLRDAGATVVRTQTPDDVEAALDTALAIGQFEMKSAISGFLSAQATGISYDELLAQVGPEIGAILATPPPARETYDAMVAQRQKIRDAIRSLFANENLMVLAFPPALIPAHPIGEDGGVTIDGERVPNTTTMGRNVALSSCAGLASLVLPAGLTSTGLPVGLEFDAMPGTDRTLLGLGIALQRALGSIPAPPV